MATKNLELDLQTAKIGRRTKSKLHFWKKIFWTDFRVSITKLGSSWQKSIQKPKGCPWFSKQYF